MFVYKKLLQSLVSIFGASVIIFMLSRISGDPATLMLPPDAPPSAVHNLRVELGLEHPLPIQYLKFAQNALQGDFGNSYRWQEPALSLILERMPATLELALAALLFSMLIAIPFGVFSAVYKDSWFDRFGKVFAMLGQAMPNFWIGLLLILFFSVRLGWLPPFGNETASSIILPAIALGWYPVAAQTRIVRSAMLDVLDSDYIRLARGSGIPSSVIIWKYSLRNALIPLITILGVYFASMLSGAFVVEVVFAWPGVGRTVVEAVLARDFPVVQAGVLLTAIIFIICNLLVDLSYALIDPRLRARP